MSGCRFMCRSEEGDLWEETREVVVGDMFRGGGYGCGQ